MRSSSEVLERLQYLRVGVPDLDEARRDYATLLGCQPLRRAQGEEGQGADFGLNGVGLRLEPIAADASPGVIGLAFGTADLAATVASLRDCGVATQPRGGECARLELSATRQIPIDVVQAEEAVVASAPLSKVAGAARLDHAVVLTRDHEAALKLYEQQLGLRLALDRSFPKRGLRLLFLRIAGVTIEIGGTLADSDSAASGQGVAASRPEARDGFGGLAWRGEDVEAWRARLVGENFDVSEVRTGHKAGTRVCSVRARTGGVPTLLIGPDANSLDPG